MKLKLIGYGFLGWLIPFAVSFFMYPFKEKGLPVFETIMTVTLVIVCIVLSVIYLRNKNKNYIKNGILLGLSLLIMSIIIDLFMFMGGPMKMGFINYMLDIGFTYFVYPIITVGIGYLLDYETGE